MKFSSIDVCVYLLHYISICATQHLLIDTTDLLRYCLYLITITVDNDDNDDSNSDEDDHGHSRTREPTLETPLHCRLTTTMVSP